MADGGRTWRASTKLTILDGKTGRPRTVNRGIKSPITGKRWGCTRNISPGAVEAYLTAKSEVLAAALLIQRKNREAATFAREAA